MWCGDAIKLFFGFVFRSIFRFIACLRIVDFGPLDLELLDYC